MDAQDADIMLFLSDNELRKPPLTENWRAMWCPGASEFAYQNMLNGAITWERSFIEDLPVDATLGTTCHGSLSWFIPTPVLAARAASQGGLKSGQAIQGEFVL